MKKKSKLMGNMKNTMKLGVGSMAGMGVMGAMGSIPGMPAGASSVTSTVGAGLNLANIGQLGKTGMGIASDFGSMNCSKKSKHKIVRNILGK